MLCENFVTDVRTHTHILNQLGAWVWIYFFVFFGIPKYVFYAFLIMFENKFVVIVEICYSF